MALVDIVERAKNIIYGTGLGRKPALRRVAADAAETGVGNEVVTFALLSGEGDKVKKGQILSVRSAETEGSAHVFYVLDVATDTVTAVDGYGGAPALTTDNIDGVVLEQNPLVTNFEIFEAIDQVVANHLWPEIYMFDTATISSPDLVNGQEAVGATVQEIVSSWQINGPDVVPVAHLPKQPLNVHTSLASTGKMVTFDWIDGSTGYYTFKRKVVEGDDDGDPDLTRLIAAGAAAIAISNSITELTLDRALPDNQNAAQLRQAASDRLWRDFLTIKGQMALELQREEPNRIYVDRG